MQLCYALYAYPPITAARQTDAQVCSLVELKLKLVLCLLLSTFYSSSYISLFLNLMTEHFSASPTAYADRIRLDEAKGSLQYPDTVVAKPYRRLQQSPSIRTAYFS